MASIAPVRRAGIPLTCDRNEDAQRPVPEPSPVMILARAGATPLPGIGKRPGLTVPDDKDPLARSAWARRGTQRILQDREALPPKRSGSTSVSRAAAFAPKQHYYGNRIQRCPSGTPGAVPLGTEQCGIGPRREGAMKPPLCSLSGRQDVRRLDVPVYVDSPEPDVASGGEDKWVRVTLPGPEVEPVFHAGHADVVGGV